MHATGQDYQDRAWKRERCGEKGAHIQEVGVVDGYAGEQVELVGALGGVPGHVV